MPDLSPTTDDILGNVEIEIEAVLDPDVPILVEAMESEREAPPQHEYRDDAGHVHFYVVNLEEGPGKEDRAGFRFWKTYTIRIDGVFIHQYQDIGAAKLRQEVERIENAIIKNANLFPNYERFDDVERIPRTTYSRENKSGFTVNRSRTEFKMAATVIRV